MVDTPGLSSEDAKKIADALRASTSASPGTSTAVDKGLNGLSGIINNGVSLLSGIAKGGNSGMEATAGLISGKLGLVGDILKGVASQATAAADAMFEMYDSGVVMRADQLTQSMQAFGQDLAGVTKLMTKHGQVISSMGIAKTIQLGQAFTELTAGGTQLGMTQEQANETLFTYTEILNTSGRLRQMNELTVINQAKEFANQLNLASQATGKNREQIQQEIKDRLKQNDIAFLRLHLSQEENDKLTRNQQQLGKWGDVGKDFFNQIALFKTQGFSAVEPGWVTALGDQGRDLFERYGQANTEEEMDAIMQEIATSIRNNPLDISQGANSPNVNAALIQGGFTQQANIISGLITDAAANNGQAAPIDETAKNIKEQQQNVTQAMNKVQGAMIDLSIVAAQNLMPQIQAVGTELKYLSDDMAGLARSMVGVNVLDDATVRALVGAGGIAAVTAFAATGARAASTGGPARTASPAAAAAAAADDALKAESWFAKLGRSLKFITGGFLLGEAGSIAKGAGYERGGAAAEIGGSAIMDTAIAKALIKNPYLALIAGTAVAAYTNLDNITTLLGGGTPATPTPTVTSTTTTATDGTETADATVVPPEQELALSITALVSEVESANMDSRRQDISMNTKFDMMIDLLTTLNTNINDQTIILKNAYNNGSGNVYP
jgi:hypothetical protein